MENWTLVKNSNQQREKCRGNDFVSFAKSAFTFAQGILGISETVLTKADLTSLLTTVS